MNFIRSLVGPAPSAGAAGGELPPAAAAQGPQQQQAKPGAGDLGDGSPMPYTPDGKAGVGKGGILPSSATPASGSGKAPYSEGVMPPTPGAGPHRRLDMGSPPEDEWREGHEAEAEEEEGEEVWYYGAETARRGWRHTENQLAVWVTALMVVAVGINIGVGGECCGGRREGAPCVWGGGSGSGAGLQGGVLPCREGAAAALPATASCSLTRSLLPACSEQLGAQQPHQEHRGAAGRAGCGHICTAAAALSAAAPGAAAALRAATGVGAHRWP